MFSTVPYLFLKRVGLGTEDDNRQETRSWRACRRTISSPAVSFHIPPNKSSSLKASLTSYRSVVASSECPSSRETALILFVAASRSVALECRSTCAETERPSIRRAARAISLEMYVKGHDILHPGVMKIPHPVG